MDLSGVGLPRGSPPPLRESLPHVDSSLSLGARRGRGQRSWSEQALPPQAPPPSLTMQPTPTMAPAASTTATVALTARWDNATGSPTAEPDPILDNYALLVVVMSLFVGGALVVLSGVLLLCRRCWEAHRRFNRATEEAEKTTTTYLDNGAHPTQDWAQRDSDSSLFP